MEGISRGSEHCRREMPAWFLDNCVKTSEELASLKISLCIQNHTPSSKNTNKEPSNLTTDSYEISHLVYQPLWQAVSPRTPEITRTAAPDAEVQRLFTNDGIVLRVPSKSGTVEGNQFLSTVVEYVAKDAGVDLVTVDANDILDLLDYHESSVLKQEEKDETRTNSIKEDSGEDSEEDSEKEDLFRLLEGTLSKDRVSPKVRSS